MWRMWHPPPVFGVGGKARLAALPFPDQGLDWGVLQKAWIFRKIQSLSGGGCSFGAPENPKHSCFSSLTIMSTFM